jgi:hypothetical protein
LAVLLTTAIAERPSGDSFRTPQELPEPFAALALECFQASPYERCGLERMRALLRQQVSEAPPQAPEPPQAEPRLMPPAAQGGLFTRAVPERRKLGRKTVAGLAAAAIVGTLFMAALIRGSSPAEDTRTVREISQQKPDPAVPGRAERAEAALNSEATEITNLLDRWVAAVRARDTASLIALYAPKVDTFYRARNVGRDFIRGERQRDFRRAGTIRPRSRRWTTRGSLPASATFFEFPTARLRVVRAEGVHMSRRT